MGWLPLAIREISDRVALRSTVGPPPVGQAPSLAYARRVRYVWPVVDYLKGVVPKATPLAKRPEDVSLIEPDRITDAEEAMRCARELNQKLQPEQAIAMLRRALELEPAHKEAVCELGSTLRDVGRFEEAREVFCETLEKNPRLGEVRLEWANCLLRQGVLDEAVAEYRRCMDERPNWDAPHKHLILALARQGKGEEAKAVLVDLLRFSPDERTVAMLENVIASVS